MSRRRHAVPARRGFVLGLASGLILLRAAVAGSPNSPNEPPAHLELSSKIRERLLALYGDDRVAYTGDIKLEPPHIPDSSCHVPVTITTNISRLSALSVFVAHNPQPHAVTLRGISEQQGPLVVRLRVFRNSPLYAIIHSQDGLLYGNQSAVTLGRWGGCEALRRGASHRSLKTRPSDRKIRMRFERRENRVLYKVLFHHPMHTRYTSKDKTADYIKDIRFYHRGRLIIHGTASVNLSGDLYLSFFLPDAKEGDEFAVQWADNLGRKHDVNTTIKYHVPKQK